MNGWDRFVADNLILMLYVLPFIGGAVFGWALREGKARLDQDRLGLAEEVHRHLDLVGAAASEDAPEADVGDRERPADRGLEWSLQGALVEPRAGEVVVGRLPKRDRDRDALGPAGARVRVQGGVRRALDPGVNRSDDARAAVVEVHANAVARCVEHED